MHVPVGTLHLSTMCIRHTKERSILQPNTGHKENTVAPTIMTLAKSLGYNHCHQQTSDIACNPSKFPPFSLQEIKSTMVITLQNHFGMHHGASCCDSARPQHTAPVQIVSRTTSSATPHALCPCSTNVPNSLPAPFIHHRPYLGRKNYDGHLLYAVCVHNAKAKRAKGSTVFSEHNLQILVNEGGGGTQIGLD